MVSKKSGIGALALVGALSLMPGVPSLAMDGSSGPDAPSIEVRENLVEREIVNPYASAELPPNVLVVGAIDFERVVVYADAWTPISPTSAKGGGTCNAPAGIQVSCQDGTGYVVTKGPLSTMRLGYQWNVAWFSGSNANVIGRGYTYGKETWHGGGVARSGSFSAPWYGPNGSSLMSIKKVKVRSMSAPAGVTVNWS